MSHWMIITLTGTDGWGNVIAILNFYWNEYVQFERFVSDYDVVPTVNLQRS